MKMTFNRKLILHVLGDEIESRPPPHSASSIGYWLNISIGCKDGGVFENMRTVPNKQQIHRTLKDLLRAGLIIGTKIKEEGNNYVGRAKIMNTPMGNIARNIIEGGGKLGVSSRGLGSLKTTSEGINEVQDDFYLATAADIVADPSAPDAFVRGIMENKEWLVVNGVWTEQHCDMSKKYIKKASKKQLEEAKIQVFERFLRHLSSK